MLSWTPEEKHNAMTIEEAVAGLNHRCRFRPGLKLSLRACELRKSKKQRIADGKSYSSFWECKDCDGPVPIESKEPPRREDTQEMRKTKYDGPSTCRTCGLSVGFTREDGSDVRFYPSRPDECIRCIKAKQEARKNPKQPSWSPIVEEPTEAVEETEFKYDCPVHGPHNGRRFGRAYSQLCPTCFREKQYGNGKIKQPPVEQPRDRSMEIPAWVRDWCREQSTEKGIPPTEYLVGLVGEKVPAEWFKEWLMKGGRA